MLRYKYKVSKIQDNGEIWEHEIGVKADKQLDAYAIILEMYPSPEYTHKFLGTE